jgi:zinc D-Ala-D-Ala carboxypeptidase
MNYQQKPIFLIGAVLPALFLLQKNVNFFGKYFTLQDVIYSRTADQNNLMGVQRQISATHIKNAKKLGREVLSPAFDFLGEKPTITSWYRSPEVNNIVGGASESKHLQARAADVVYTKNGARRNDLLARAFLQRSDFDRMLLEKGTKQNPRWIHIETSAPGIRPRKKILYTSDGVTWQNVSFTEALSLFA